MKKSLLFLLSLAALFSSCELLMPDTPQDEPVAKPSAGIYSLPLIQTSDMHGYIVNTDESGATHYPLAYIAGKADALRRDGDKNSLLLLDGGDLYQGASISNMLAGEPVYSSIHIMGYDAVALGNHEFDWGFANMVDPDATLPDYEWQGKQVANKVPVVCSNLLWNGARTSFTKDYVIVEKTAFKASGEALTIKVAIIGSAANYASSIMTSKFSGAGFSLYNNTDDVNSTASYLEANGLCDATIMLSHENAVSAAERLGAGTAVDLVLGGHSHQRQLGTSSTGLPYLQGGSNCGSYAQAYLQFNVGEDGSVSFGSIEDMEIVMVDTAQDKKGSKCLSADIVQVSDAAIEACSAQLNTVVGYIDVSASRYYLSGSGERATVMSNWMCDILRSIGEADVAFVNSGGVRTAFPLNGLSKRDITVANVYEMFPFDNAVYVYDLTYADLLRLFEYSMTSGGQGLFYYMTGLDCYFSSTESSSSVKALCKDGETIYESGKWKGSWASKSVRLAASEYIATTERTDYYTGMANPLIEWNKSSKLVSSEQIDNASAVLVLKAEAAASGGHLRIDTEPHFLLY